MQYRTLGRSGLLVSLVGLGANNFGFRDDLDVDATVGRALDLGITFIDTAESYGEGKSEANLAPALRHRRKDVIIGTKWGVSRRADGSTPVIRNGSRDYIMKAAERSLANLKTDYIDLYQFHRPDPGTPLDETVRACDDLIRQGKVRYVGLSNMPAWQVVEAQFLAGELGADRFISCQDEYSLLRRDIVEPDLATVMERFGLGLLPYFPLASGMLTGKYRRGEAAAAGTRFDVMKPIAGRFGTEKNWDIVDRLTAFAEARGHTILELAFSWLAARPGVGSIIAGATRPEQVEANAAAADWTLTPDDLAELDRITGIPDLRRNI
ncbi:MAG TPA: aldo/keto reductase [Stellaceae bacterium]|nr:aldo/keto reductase [Stellaceae bacterium]